MLVGQSIPLITRREFDFSNLAESEAENVVTIVMVKQLPVTMAAKADMIVRVHSRTITTTNANSGIAVVAQDYSQDPGDPGEDFFTGPPLTSNVGLIPLNMNTEVGDLGVERLQTPYGEMLRFLVIGRRVQNDSGSIIAEISVNLIPRASN